MATITKDDTSTAQVKFLVLEKSLIGNEIHEPGAVVTLPEGTLPAENLQAMDDAGHALKERYKQENAERVKKMKADHADSAVGDPADFAKALAKANAESNDALAEKLGAAVAAGISQGIAQLIANGTLTPAAKATGKGAKGESA